MTERPRFGSARSAARARVLAPGRPRFVRATSFPPLRPAPQATTIEILDPLVHLKPYVPLSSTRTRADLGPSAPASPAEQALGLVSKVPPAPEQLGDDLAPEQRRLDDRADVGRPHTTVRDEGPVREADLHHPGVAVACEGRRWWEGRSERVAVASAHTGGEGEGAGEDGGWDRGGAYLRCGRR